MDAPKPHIEVFHFSNEPASDEKSRKAQSRNRIR